MGETDATAEVERYIAIPSQALAYKIGALTIQRLKAKAETELGAEVRSARIPRSGAQHRRTADERAGREDQPLDRRHQGLIGAGWNAPMTEHPRPGALRRAGLSLPFAQRPAPSQRDCRDQAKMPKAARCCCVRIAAPPAEGAANAALVDLLALALGLRKRDVTIRSGETRRNKQVHLSGEPKALIERLIALLAT